ncbi:MAG TPA: hypothetical protein VFJ59_09165, partial [Pseudolabrys sp.]|nr:hypothetical protein [Pseudolabrys sp.]
FSFGLRISLAKRWQQRSDQREFRARRLFDLNDEAKMAAAQNSSDRATTSGDFLGQSIRMTFSVHTQGADGYFQP